MPDDAERGTSRVITFEVGALHCPGCVRRLETVLGHVPGVAVAKVDFLAGLAYLSVRAAADEAALVSAVDRAIEDAGFVSRGLRRADGHERDAMRSRDELRSTG